MPVLRIICDHRSRAICQWVADLLGWSSPPVYSGQPPSIQGAQALCPLLRRSSAEVIWMSMTSLSSSSLGCLAMSTTACGLIPFDGVVVLHAHVTRHSVSCLLHSHSLPHFTYVHIFRKTYYLVAPPLSVQGPPLPFLSERAPGMQCWTPVLIWYWRQGSEGTSTPMSGCTM